MQKMIKKYKEISEKTKDLLQGFYSNYALELMATVDFLLVTDVRLKDWLSKDREYVRSIIDCDLAEWSKRKQQKFSESHFC